MYLSSAISFILPTLISSMNGYRVLFDFTTKRVIQEGIFEPNLHSDTVMLTCSHDSDSQSVNVTPHGCHI